MVDRVDLDSVELTKLVWSKLQVVSRFDSTRQQSTSDYKTNTLDLVEAIYGELHWVCSLTKLSGLLYTRFQVGHELFELVNSLSSHVGD